MSLAQRLEQSWYDARHRPLWWTWPLMLLYRAITGLRRWLYAIGWLRAQRLDVPVIVVGNLTAGGTGKTPLTMALVTALRARGWHPGVVSRGYGGSAREPQLLGDSPNPAAVGDEPCLLHAGGATVAIGRERAAAAALLVAYGCDLIIADDGLQHYALARDVEICVIDGARRFGNGHLLPAGPLREPVSRLRIVDFRVCNGGEPQAGEFAMRLDGDCAVALVGGDRQRLEAWTGQSVNAVAAIGHPARFFESLRARGLTVIEHPFPDHHSFVAADFDFDDDHPLLMTDKDAIKCGAFAKPHWWRVPVTASLPDALINQLTQRLKATSNA